MYAYNSVQHIVRPVQMLPTIVSVSIVVIIMIISIFNMMIYN